VPDNSRRFVREILIETLPFKVHPTSERRPVRRQLIVLGVVGPLVEALQVWR
jgi:hypothetical protein